MATTATQQANLFELSCAGMSITYATTSITGTPLLSYSGPEGDLSFSGSGIETLPTALGTEVTVTLETVADLHTITLTVLIPSFRLPEDHRSTFDTLAIKTTNHTTIAGPPEGAGESYEAIALHGVAKFVLF
jgi:hypothetical protein